MASEFFVRMKKETEQVIGNLPRFGKDLLQLAHRAEQSVKGFFTPGMLFEAFGFDYFGPIDGHNLEELTETLTKVTRLKGPVLVHVVTRKGKGYLPAEQAPAKFHGVGPFDRSTGEVKPSSAKAPSYTEVFGQTLIDLADADSRVVGITAAMAAGTGLKPFAARFPERSYDVGIAEQHAVTFAAGMATSGMRPVVAVYSTFLQRAYDQVVHDVCLQNLPVCFAIDRGGLVGADGPTHHGVFDLSYLRHIPNLVCMLPRNEQQLRNAMVTGLQQDGPFAYRYPRGNGEGVSIDGPPRVVPVGKGEKLRDGNDGVILAAGTRVATALEAAANLAAEGLELAVVDPVFLKPLDAELICAEANRTGVVITVEENVLQGGFGSAVLELLTERQLSPRVLTIGLPDRFIEQGGQTELYARYRIDAAGLTAQVGDFLKAGSAEDISASH